MKTSKNQRQFMMTKKKGMIVCGEAEIWNALYSLCTQIKALIKSLFCTKKILNYYKKFKVYAGDCVVKSLCAHLFVLKFAKIENFNLFNIINRYHYIHNYLHYHHQLS